MTSHSLQTEIEEAGAGKEQYPLHHLLSKRRSTRAFSDQPVEPEKLFSILEAARWAPSASNMQPWRFIVARKEQAEDYNRLANLLVEGNKLWAEKAPVLILSVAQVVNPVTQKVNRFALHDVGQAAANLTVQATSLGISVHQMGGFYADRASEVLNVPAGYEPVAMIALGYEAPVESLPQNLIERELSPRVRKPLSELVFDGGWEIPSSLILDELRKNLVHTSNN